jgi:predicted DNA binding CopG/RHH family protein
MTNDAKKNFTLRIKNELSEKVEKEASNLGISQTAYITMVLHKALREEKTS